MSNYLGEDSMSLGWREWRDWLVKDAARWNAELMADQAEGRRLNVKPRPLNPIQVHPPFDEDGIHYPLSVELPHQCETWEIGDLDDLVAFISDLQAILAEAKT